MKVEHPPRILAREEKATTTATTTATGNKVFSVIFPITDLSHNYVTGVHWLTRAHRIRLVLEPRASNGASALTRAAS